jgi:hypothetical protein
MAQTNPKKLNLKSPLIVVLIVVAALFCVVAAAVVLTAPEHIQGTPQNPTPSPTASPTASPSPSPTVVPTELHLSSNLTTPFYTGSTLRLTAQLNTPTAGVVITLYNNGAVMTTAVTDASGKAVFDRAPTNAFDYTATASLT